MLCVALYTGDDKWYRAVIEDIPEKKQVDVRYVDYGNKERLWYKQLYKITEDFLKLPAQVYLLLLLFTLFNLSFFLYLILG